MVNGQYFTLARSGTRAVTCRRLMTSPWATPVRRAERVPFPGRPDGVVAETPRRPQPPDGEGQVHRRGEHAPIADA